MNVNLKALRSRLYSFRSWDSSGDTLDKRIQASLNLALDRLAGDVPEALIPDEMHIALRGQVLGTDELVKARAAVTTDQRVLAFIDTGGTNVGGSSLTTWRPEVNGTWDGVMHIEFKDASGAWRRRQCLEFFIDDSSYYVTIDRPLYQSSGAGVGAGRAEFRLFQPEFFLRDDVMEVLEPARIYDETRQKVWAIDTAGAYRQDMVDYQGENRSRPCRMWRGRHFQLPAPTEAPEVAELLTDQEVSVAQKNVGTRAKMLWGHGTAPGTYRTGTWAIRYTYVMGKRDAEWQQSPLIHPDVTYTAHNSSYKLSWAYEGYGAASGTIGLDVGVNASAGVNDPLWESAPSPVTTFKQSTPVGGGPASALVLAASDIGMMQGFGPDSAGLSSRTRFSRSGYRIRYYVSYRESAEDGFGDATSVETNDRFYFLCEVDPTFDQVAGSAYTPAPFTSTGTTTRKKGGRVVWNGDQLFDYHRKLRFSTGYYAWKVYPHQDARYELDFRVLRLPSKFEDDQDTAPIQRDAIPALIELALHYVCLADGADQQGAALHLDRYTELARKYRERYANPGGVVEPVPLLGYSSGRRYGTFNSG
tara:strand:- start:513 stop:2273 length:1761 start_codon:yes stop_codon:yes gene_type:complete